MASNLNIFPAAPVDVVVMAAGKGTRMKSKLPKVLHLLARRALLKLPAQRHAVFVVPGRRSAIEVRADPAYPRFAGRLLFVQVGVGVGVA